MIPEDRPICVPCRVSRCPCQSYHYVPLNGTQPIRCRCKHFADQHSAAPGHSCNSCKLRMGLQCSLWGNLTGTVLGICILLRVLSMRSTCQWWKDVRWEGRHRLLHRRVRTTSLALLSPVKECKCLNDSVRYRWRQPPKIRQHESTPFAVSHFHCCTHMTFFYLNLVVWERKVLIPIPLLPGWI